MATEHRFNLRGIEAVVTLPDGLPEGVRVSVDVDLDATAIGQEGARQAFAALGGADVFERPNPHGDRAWCRMLQEGRTAGALSTYGPCEVALVVPSGRPEPVSLAPFVAELFEASA